MQKILIIDDDAESCEQTAEYLRSEGYDSQVVHSGEDGVEAVNNQAYLAVIMDVVLPGIGGFEVLRRLRAISSVPLIVTTARSEEIDRILGLELGADDYLAKPFSRRELVARLRAVLRRCNDVAINSQPNTLKINGMELNSAAHSVFVDDRQLELTSVEFRLLELLMRAAGNTVTRREIAEKVLGRELAPLDRSIDTHISNLRRKIGEGRSGSRIKTIRGTGYIFTKPHHTS